jgi:aspartate-semialdehyde dehydrogenase
VSVKLSRPASPEAARKAIESFCSPVADLDLPSAPSLPVAVVEDGPRPQPKLDVDRGRGMTVTVGRIRRCPVFDLRFVALVHNTERGAAGAAVLNAELMAATGRLG